MRVIECAQTTYWSAGTRWRARLGRESFHLQPLVFRVFLVILSWPMAWHVSPHASSRTALFAPVVAPLQMPRLCMNTQLGQRTVAQARVTHLLELLLAVDALRFVRLWKVQVQVLLCSTAFDRGKLVHLNATNQFYTSLFSKQCCYMANLSQVQTSNIERHEPKSIPTASCQAKEPSVQHGQGTLTSLIL